MQWTRKERAYMKLMISQPMHGKSNEQIKMERESLVKELEAQGHEVIDTVFDFDIDKSGVWYLAKSIEAMEDVDGVVFMPGWNQTRGCIIENQVALAYNKFVKYV